MAAFGERRCRPLVLALVLLLAAAGATPDCEALAPQPSARRNYEAILRCLSVGQRRAALQEGVFLLHRGLALPEGSTLTGLAAAATPAAAGAPAGSDPLRYARLQIASPTAMTSYVVRTGNDTSLSYLTLDGAENLRGGTNCTAIISVMGSNSSVDAVEVLNTAVGAGVYFHGAAAVENRFSRVHVHRCYYGVVFEHGLLVESWNVFSGGVVEDIACDAVVFAGYAELKGNTVRNSGFGCGRRTPVQPGGGIHCSGNLAGGVISENMVYGNCGKSLDIDTCANFNVSFNTFDRSGSIAAEQGHCAGATSVTLLDVRDSVFQGNTVINEHVSSMLGRAPQEDPDQVFEDTELLAQPFSDLPGGPRTVVAFALLRRPRAAAQRSVDNVVHGNRFRASCRDEVDCISVGYFAGRGTGLDEEAAPKWRYKFNPSKFTANVVEDASLASKRCGANWFAGDSPTCVRGSGPPCNEDDYLHPEANYRNDLGCRAYSKFVGESVSLEGIGRLRVPLPLPFRGKDFEVFS